MKLGEGMQPPPALLEQPAGQLGKKKKLDSYITPSIQIDFKWTKYVNVRNKTKSLKNVILKIISEQSRLDAELESH